MTRDLLQQRQRYSSRRLEAVRKRVARIPELGKYTNLSIYVTGSYGRLEAHPGSDLDLFFVSDGELQLDRTTKILIDAALIKIAREMKFPPFSND